MSPTPNLPYTSSLVELLISEMTEEIDQLTATVASLSQDKLRLWTLARRKTGITDAQLSTLIGVSAPLPPDEGST